MRVYTCRGRHLAGDIDRMVFCQHSFKYARVWIAVAWFGVGLLVFLSLTRLDMSGIVPYGDKSRHVAAYALLTCWFMQLYHGARHRIVVVLGLFALGVVLEALQYWTGYRSMEAADAVADAVGIA